MRISLSILLFGLMAACSSTPSTSPAPEPKALPQADKGTQGAPNAAPEQPANSKMEAVSKVECTNKTDKRMLELRSKGKGCEVAYTKSGQEGIVASSASGNAHCESTVNKIKERLQGSGFECK